MQLLKMEQIYTLFRSITLFNLDSLMFNVINSSLMNNFTTSQELSRTLKNTQEQQNGSGIKGITSFDNKVKGSP